MAALALHIGRRHEGGADEEKHRRLVLPVVGAVEKRTTEYAVAEDGARRDQRDCCEHHDDGVAEVERVAECRHERIARNGVGAVILIRKRTMHHAATSLASFSREAEVAVLAL